jgi:hypothetical protein
VSQCESTQEEQCDQSGFQDHSRVTPLINIQKLIKVYICKKDINLRTYIWLYTFIYPFRMEKEVVDRVDEPR